jgi:mRNA interferase RelE/StbE
MNFDIYLSNQVKKFLENCDSSLRHRLEELFKVLQENPLLSDIYDIGKVKGLKKSYRVRLGSYRVIIQLFPTNKEIYILKIDKRGSVYKNIS